MSFGKLVQAHKENKRRAGALSIGSGASKKGMPVNKGVILPALEDYLRSNAGREDDGMMHASEAKSYCPRAHAIVEIFAKGAKESAKARIFSHLPINLLATFEIGTAVHSHWQNDILGPAGVLFGVWRNKSSRVHSGITSVGPNGKILSPPASWVPMPTGRVAYEFVESSAKDDDLRMSGSIDGGVMLGNVMVGLEIKTISQRGFDALEGVQPEHKVQADVYCHLFGLPAMVFLYISKGWHQTAPDFVSPIKHGFTIGPFKEYVYRPRPATIAAIRAGRVLEERSIAKFPTDGEDAIVVRLKACSTKFTTRAKQCDVCEACHLLSNDGPEWKGESALK